MDQVWAEGTDPTGGGPGPGGGPVPHLPGVQRLGAGDRLSRWGRHGLAGAASPPLLLPFAGAGGGDGSAAAVLAGAPRRLRRIRTPRSSRSSFPFTTHGRSYCPRRSFPPSGRRAGLHPPARRTARCAWQISTARCAWQIRTARCAWQTSTARCAWQISTERCGEPSSAGTGPSES